MAFDTSYAYMTLSIETCIRRTHYSIPRGFTVDTFSQLSQLETLRDDTRSGKKREIGFHWLEYFLDASDVSSIQPWPNRTFIVVASAAADFWIARFL